MSKAMSDVDLVKRAAAVMRYRAKVANIEAARDASDFEEYALTRSLKRMPAIRAHITAMRPDVALAVADAWDQAVAFWWGLPEGVRTSLTAAAATYLKREN